MPILLSVHSAKRGGAERMALAEARHLKRWYDLVIAVPEGPMRESFAVEGELVRGTASLPLWGAPARTWLARSARTVRDALRMAALIRRRGIRLVLTNSAVSVAPVLAARIARVPAIVHVRDVPVSRLAPRVFALQAALADTVITISASLEPYFSRPRRARVVMIPEGIDHSGLPTLADRAAGNGFGAPLRLCLVGAISTRKAQDVGIEAVGRLGERGVDAVLELVGRDESPAFAARLRGRVRELGLGERVRFTGEAEDMDAVLARTDIVIAPSRGEWTPLVLMEALAHGKPVVASGVGGVPDLLLGGRAGLLTPPEDPEAVAVAVAELAADPPAARAMADRGRAHVAERFDLAKTLEGVRAEVEGALAR